jgi:hypothetical protein
MRNQLRSSTGAASFKLQAPTRVEIMYWIGSSWSSLSVSTIANGFRSVVDQVGIETDDYNAIVEQLDRLDLLDGDVGEVQDTDDVVAAELGTELEAESPASKIVP